MSFTRLLFASKLCRTDAVSLFCHRNCTSQRVFNFSDPSIQKYLSYLVLENETLHSKEQRNKSEIKKLREMKPIVKVVTERLLMQKDIECLKTLREHEEDDQVKNMFREESQIYTQRIKDNESQLKSLLLEPYLCDSGVLIEVKAGEGEQACAFAKDLLDLYQSYANFKNWDCDLATVVRCGTDGITKGLMLVRGMGALQLMKLEAGVHHKISIEKNDVVASIVRVGVKAQPTDSEVDVDPSEIIVETEQNKSCEAPANSVAITHTPTGIIVESKEGESLVRNKQIAMQILQTELYQIILEGQADKSDDKFKATRGSKQTIRTYNYIEGHVKEHREGGGQHSLHTFMVSGKLIDRLQDALLRQQRYQDLMDDIKVFKEKYLTEDDEDVYTVF